MNSTIAKLADEFEKMEKTIASQKKMIETLMPTGYVDAVTKCSPSSCVVSANTFCMSRKTRTFLRNSEKSPQNPVPVAANRKKVCGDFSAERKGSRERFLWRNRTMNNDAVRELLNAVGALAEMSLNFYRASLNAGATKEEAFVLLQSFISASIHGSKEGSDED